MEIIKDIASVRKRIGQFKTKSLSVGFVPTMGALHNGHITLVNKSVEQNDITVVSIFVNPTQFNNKEDLKKYPRNLDKDAELLEKAKCTIIFAPDEKEMYPEDDKRIFELDGLDNIMEGKFRPGHFNGVCQIVSKFFEIVTPHKAYFGLKDFQQLAVIKKMNEKYLQNLNIEIIPCEIVRESDGLAMSSRNIRLSKEHRKASVLISNTLFEINNLKNNLDISKLKDYIITKINSNPLLKVEYFEIVDLINLLPVSTIEANTTLRACIAVFAGDVRLIDNVTV